MAERLFVTSVANLTAFDENDNVVLTGKALLDTSLKTALSKLEIRGGKGHALLMNYFHSSGLECTILNPEWSLEYIARAVGATLVTGFDVYTSETITLVAHAGTVSNTPLAAGTSTVYGWVEHNDGSIERVAFTGSAFTCVSGSATETVCVKYFYYNAAAKNITIPANIIPSVVRVVLDAQLISNTDVQNVVGVVEVIIPKLMMSGVADISLKSDGAAQTNISGSALAYAPSNIAGCTATTDIYAYVTQVKYNTNWYDDCVGISILNGDVALTHPASLTLSVRSIHSDGSVGTPPVADLSFTSGTVGTCTIGLHTGAISTVAAGTSLIHCWVTNKAALDVEVTVTVS